MEFILVWGGNMKIIDFGMPTLIETNTIEECVKLCKELRLNFIELNMNLPQYQIETINIQQLKSICKNENIYFTIHLDENLNVCDFNNKISKAYLETVLSTIDMAKQLEIPVLNMHMPNGVYFTLPTGKVFLFNRYKDIYLEKLNQFRDLCKNAIGDSNIKICVENCSGFKEFTMEGIELLLESDVFALTLDIGHSHVVNGIDEPFINKNIGRLYHMHAHDAMNRQNHLPIGSGEINISERLLLAREHGCRVVLETKTIAGLKESVESLNNYK